MLSSICIRKLTKDAQHWVGYYTRKVLHFGCLTTQRAEGAHAEMKKVLKCAGRLDKAVEALDIWHQEKVMNLSMKSC
jgi:hypothetical protein